MSWTFCTSGAPVFKAGANVSSEVSTSGAILTAYSDMAEGRIVAETRIDWREDYANLPIDIQNALTESCTTLIGNMLIAYDMSGYTSREEAQTMLDLNYDSYNKMLGLLKDFKSITIKPAR